MARIFGGMMIFLGVAASLMADEALQVPEISAGSAMSAMALISGGLIVLRGRRKS